MVKSYKRIDGLDEMGWNSWRDPYRYFRKYLKAPLLSAPLCGANNNDNNHDCHYNHHHDHQNRDYHDPPPQWASSAWGQSGQCSRKAKRSSQSLPDGNLMRISISIIATIALHCCYHLLWRAVCEIVVKVHFFHQQRTMLFLFWKES